MPCANTPPAGYFSYWGKARSLDARPDLHLLAYHALDVAAVGDVYLQRSPALLAWLAQQLGQTDLAATRAWVVFWLSLHDLGKFSISFQGQRADLVQQLQGEVPAFLGAAGVRHDSLGMAFWSGYVHPQAQREAWFGGNPQYDEGLDFWARAVTGHHGQPPLERVSHLGRHFNPRDVEAALDFVGAVRALLLPAQAASVATALDGEAFELRSCELSWWVAGLAVLADWIGSNAEIFKYRSTPDLALQDYWQQALGLAQQALEQSEVLPSQRQPERPFQQLFPGIQTPSPLQTWAASAALAPSPQIHLLEDVTGAGKTEAAIMLAHRLMAQGCADGFFIGLPTMATANAMYERVAQVYGQLFSSMPSLVLAHGRKALVESFAASVVQPGHDENDVRQGDESATRRCSRWLADHNKRALLAPAGVGTIDQALLGALCSKHQSLRLLGLWRKVLVVDEVHACDAYMQETLEKLLEFHASAGGSAILLSATLTQQMKSSLLQAYGRGLGCRGPALGATAYPLVTTWAPHSALVATEVPLATRRDVRRTVQVHYTSDFDAVLEHITAALAVGQCVAWIRNTVGDALAAYDEMAQRIPVEHILLFHARFALGDRLAREDAVLDTFGLDSGPQQRAGRLLIATQVAEQSLDIDADVVVTDLAPVDRLLQRAGRLRRHVRDAQGKRLMESGAQDERGPACLWVLGPAWTPTPLASWFRDVFPKSSKVYAHHGQLWLTARALQTGSFTMPDDARTLIESIFGPDAEVPESLERNAQQAEGAAFAEASQAQMLSAKRQSGYCRAQRGLDWEAETVAPSRLGEETVDVLLARWDANVLRPWWRDKSPQHAWAYSTVRVARRLIGQAVQESAPERVLARQNLSEQLPGGGKWVVVLGLDGRAGGFEGAALAGKAGQTQNQNPLVWTYDSRRGLRRENAQGGGPPSA
ncbi:MAG: CRISPR-associated helicase Cas3' [Acidovorax sp.]|nr:CRISPR-associated helicase Cas3' [Acidovorax sp.]